MSRTNLIGKAKVQVSAAFGSVAKDLDGITTKLKSARNEAGRPIADPLDEQFERGAQAALSYWRTIDRIGSDIDKGVFSGKGLSDLRAINRELERLDSGTGRLKPLLDLTGNLRATSLQGRSALKNAGIVVDEAGREKARTAGRRLTVDRLVESEDISGLREIERSLRRMKDSGDAFSRTLHGEVSRAISKIERQTRDAADEAARLKAFGQTAGKVERVIGRGDIAEMRQGHEYLLNLERQGERTYQSLRRKLGDAIGDIEDRAAEADRNREAGMRARDRARATQVRSAISEAKDTGDTSYLQRLNGQLAASQRNGDSLARTLRSDINAAIASIDSTKARNLADDLARADREAAAYFRRQHASKDAGRSATVGRVIGDARTQGMVTDELRQVLRMLDAVAAKGDLTATILRNKVAKAVRSIGDESREGRFRGRLETQVAEAGETGDTAGLRATLRNLERAERAGDGLAAKLRGDVVKAIEDIDSRSDRIRFDKAVPQIREMARALETAGFTGEETYVSLRRHFELLNAEAGQYEHHLIAIDRLHEEAKQSGGSIAALGSGRQGQRGRVDNVDNHQFRYISSQLAFGADDFIQSYQYGGLRGGLRGLSNNLSAIAPMMFSNPLAGAAAVVGISAFTAALPSLLEMFGTGAESVDEFTSSLQSMVSKAAEGRKVLQSQTEDAKGERSLDYYEDRIRDLEGEREDAHRMLGGFQEQHGRQVIAKGAWEEIGVPVWDAAKGEMGSRIERRWNPRGERLAWQFGAVEEFYQAQELKNRFDQADRSLEMAKEGQRIAKETKAIEDAVGGIGQDLRHEIAQALHEQGRPDSKAEYAARRSGAFASAMQRLDQEIAGLEQHGTISSDVAERYRGFGERVDMAREMVDEILEGRGHDYQFADHAEYVKAQQRQARDMEERLSGNPALGIMRDFRRMEEEINANTALSEAEKRRLVSLAADDASERVDEAIRGSSESAPAPTMEIGGLEDLRFRRMFAVPGEGTKDRQVELTEKMKDYLEVIKSKIETVTLEDLEV